MAPTTDPTVDGSSDSTKPKGTDEEHNASTSSPKTEPNTPSIKVGSNNGENNGKNDVKGKGKYKGKGKGKYKNKATDTATGNVNGTANGAANGAANGHNGHNGNVSGSNSHNGATPSQHGSMPFPHNFMAGLSHSSNNSSFGGLSAPGPPYEPPFRSNQGFFDGPSRPFHRGYDSPYRQGPSGYLGDASSIYNQHSMGGPPQNHFPPEPSHPVMNQLFPHGEHPPVPSHGHPQQYDWGQSRQNAPSWRDPLDPPLNSPSRVPPPPSSHPVPVPTGPSYQPPLVVDGSSSVAHRRPAHTAGNLENTNGNGPSSQRIALDEGRLPRQLPHHPPHQPPQQPPQQLPRQPAQQQNKNRAQRRSGPRMEEMLGLDNGEGPSSLRIALEEGTLPQQSSQQPPFRQPAQQQNIDRAHGAFNPYTGNTHDPTDGPSGDPAPTSSQDFSLHNNGDGNATNKGRRPGRDRSMRGNRRESGSTFRSHQSGQSSNGQNDHGQKDHGRNGSNRRQPDFRQSFGPSMHGNHQASFSIFGSEGRELYQLGQSGHGNFNNDNSNNNSNTWPNGYAPPSSVPMSRNSTDRLLAQSHRQRQSAANQSPQLAHTASQEIDNSFVIPSNWHIETPSQLKDYLKSLYAFEPPFGIMFTIDMRGHRLGDKDGHIDLITIKADPINRFAGHGDALIVVNSLTKLGNHNIADTKRKGVEAFRNYLDRDSIDACKPRLIHVDMLGKAAFFTTFNELSLAQIIQSAKYPKLMFAPQVPAVTLASEYGIYFDSVPDKSQHYNYTNWRNWIWDRKMTIPTGLIDIQLLDAALRVTEEILPNIARLLPFYAIVSMKMCGWFSSLATGGQRNPRQRTDEFDPAIRIRLIENSKDMPYAMMPDSSPLKYQIRNTVVVQNTKDSLAVARLSEQDNQRPYTGNNLFCNVRSPPNNDDDGEVDLARFCVRNVVYMSHLFCIFNTEMHEKRPGKYLTSITLHDVRSHTRSRIRLAISTGNIDQPPISESPWNADWESKCLEQARQYGHAYYPRLSTDHFVTPMHGQNSQQTNTANGTVTGTATAPTNATANGATTAPTTNVAMTNSNAAANTGTMAPVTTAHDASLATVETSEAAVVDTAAEQAAPPNSLVTEEGEEEEEAAQESEALDDPITQNDLGNQVPLDDELEAQPENGSPSS